MTKQYIAEHSIGRNHSPIAASTPLGVWRELEAATHRTRDELRTMGWKVVLDDGVRPTTTESIQRAEYHSVAEDDSSGAAVLSWMLALGLITGVLLVLAYHNFW